MKPRVFGVLLSLFVITSALGLLNIAMPDRIIDDPLTDGQASAKSSSYITVNKLVIDGNWSAVEAAYSWCTGLGTIGSPYVISGIEVNGLFSGSAMVIKNTNNYFIIENSTFFNGGESSGNAGINLQNVRNGIIRTTNIAEIYEGIRLDSSCSAITITNNQWLDGKLTYGVSAVSSTNIVVSYNSIIAKYQAVSFNGADNSKIIHNPKLKGGVNTIGLPYGANNNLVENNTIVGTGIWLNNGNFGGSGSSNNTIQKNIIKDISSYSLYYLAGVWIGEGASLNKILENTFSNISYKGLFDDQYIGDAVAISGASSYNQVKNNSISNVENGIALVDSINNTVTGNDIRVYQECIRGNSISYNIVNTNTCQKIERSSGIPAIDWLLDNIQWIIIIAAAGIAILVIATIATKKQRISKQSKGRSLVVTDVGTKTQSFTPQAPIPAIPLSIPAIMPSPVILSEPVLLPVNERVALFYCQSCKQNHEVKNPNLTAWYGCPTCGNVLSLLAYCINCHNPMMLTKELYAAYKGRAVQCPTCKNPVTIE